MNEETIVKDFANSMLKKIELRHNRYAPLGWQTMDAKRILELLKNEIKEFEEYLYIWEPDDIGELKAKRADEAIDIANYAMFLWFLSK